MTRLTRSVILYLLCLLYSTLINACGIAVHNEVSYRSIALFKPRNELEQKYKNLISTMPGFMQAGSFFPDWGYQCLGYNQQSEDAHWAPFIKTAIQYVRETYPQPWTDPHIQGLVVFIFAIMSHDIADVKWHSLNGLDNYFVQVMAQMEFDGDYQHAHTVADTGAEFTLQHASRLGYLNETWKVPLQDLVNIYRLYYDNDPSMVPSEDHLRYCMVAAYAGVKLDLKFGKWMFNYYGAKSPFMVDQLNDYHKGGLQDLASSVSLCYRDMIRSFEGVIPDILCSNYFDDGKSNSRYQRQPQHHIYQPNDLDQLLLDNGIIAQVDDQTGILTLTSQQQHNPSKPNQQSVFRKPQFPFPAPRDPCRSVTPKTGLPTLSIPTSLAGFGHAIVHGDFNGDGHTDLAISAPYHDPTLETTMAGAVFILDGTHPWNESLQLSSHQSGARFGWALAVLDMNHDGIDDLAISAPFSHHLRGHVDIFYGSPDGLSSTPNRTILGSDEGFGYTLAAFDIDHDGYPDLLVGCPYCTVNHLAQAGVVYVYSNQTGSLDRSFFSDQPSRYERFGSAMAFSSIGMLVIGAPGANIDGLPQVGRVYGFQESTLQWIMVGQVKFEQFGSVLEGWKDDYLAITSPTEDTFDGLQKYWQGGTVRLYNWHALAQGVTSRDSGLIRKLSGHQVSGHFGTSLSFFQHHNGRVGLWIGEPLGHQERGRIYRWMLDEDGLECLEDEDTMARFGSRIISVESGLICVTSQHGSHGARFSGAVHLYQFI